jgi:4-amino-4-deoxy-L-arabinose transferase-like glycosyltransferase
MLQLGPWAAMGLIALIGWTTLMAFYDLDGGAEFEPTDCWVAQTAREMLEVNDWIVPRFSGETRMQKSPGPYWAVMLASVVRGEPVDKISARLPNAIAAVLITIAVFWLALRIAGERAAVFAGFAAASSTLVLYWSHRGASDLGLAAFITLSLACLWVATRCCQPGWRRGALWIAGYFFAGMGMLYKMPMPLACVGLPAFCYLWMRFPVVFTVIAACGAAGLVIFKLGLAIPLAAAPGAIVIIYLLILWYRTERKVWPTILCHVSGFVVFLLPWLPWAIVVMIKEPAAWMKWKVEFLDRFTGELPNVEHQDTWPWLFFYLIPTVVYTLPYTLSVPAALKRAVTEREGVDRDGLRFMLIWFVSMFVFFTASTGKETRYFLPALPPLYVLLGLELSALFDPKTRIADWRIRFATRAVLIGMPLGLAAGAVGMYKWNRIQGLFEWSQVWPAYLALALPFGIGAMTAAILYQRGRRNASFAALAGTMWLTWLCAWPYLMPVMASEKPFLNFADQLANKLPRQYRDDLRHIGSQDSRIIWYSDVRMPRIIDQLVLLERQGGDRSLAREEQIVAEEMIEQLREDDPILLVASRPHYVRFLIEAPRELAERGQKMPESYLWLQTTVGEKKKQFVIFGNKKPPWDQPPLTPPSERLQKVRKQRQAQGSNASTAPPAATGPAATATQP